MSFDNEVEAFRCYADLYPDNVTLLVDTYDTLRSGVPAAIRVFKELREQGRMPKKYGIRLDSGDLAYLSKKAYAMLCGEGFQDAIICASSDLDEYLINSLKLQGAKINSWGVGTNLITSKDWPAFGGVYKLSAMESDGKFVPKIKLSENPVKITNPGNKTIFRIYDKETGKIYADLISLVGEKYDENEDLLLFDPIATWKKSILPGGSYVIREMLVPVFLKGKCVYETDPVMKIRDYCKKELDTLWEETRRFANPHEVYVDLSQPLYDMKKQLLDNIHTINMSK